MNIAYDSLRHQNTPTINSETQSVINGLSTTAFTPESVIDIHVSCRNLIKLDSRSESDAMIALFIPINGTYTEIARTEVVWNNKNPKFVKFFKALYTFEAQQPLLFNVYDCDSEKAELNKHDFIGYYQLEVYDLISHLDQELVFDLKNDNQPGFRGQLVLKPEQPICTGTMLIGEIQVLDLKKVKTFAKNNPYIEISKPSETGEDIPVYRSEVHTKCQGCTFKSFSLALQNLSNNGFDSPIIITCFDYSQKKEPVLLGKCSTNIQTFLNSVGTKYQLTDSKNKKVGILTFKNLTYHRIPSFLDYLRNGLQIKLVTAIDLTASNNEPNDPTSLHYIDPNGLLNPYQQCIEAVGSVLVKYDHDQEFPVYGFGGKVKNSTNPINHCLPLTLDEEHPTVYGLEGIKNIYKESIYKVGLYGPTLFTPIIRKCIEMANKNYTASHIYTVLLIITDGDITDMQDTVDAIVDASEAPLSIIIVGVGESDFKGMKILDADDEPLVSSSGKKMKRDIVQFVPFQKFAKGGVELEREVLKEIPQQVHRYCSTHGFGHLTQI